MAATAVAPAAVALAAVDGPVLGAAVVDATVVDAPVEDAETIEADVEACVEGGGACLTSSGGFVTLAAAAIPTVPAFTLGYGLEVTD